MVYPKQGLILPLSFYLPTLPYYIYYMANLAKHALVSEFLIH